MGGRHFAAVGLLMLQPAGGTPMLLEMWPYLPNLDKLDVCWIAFFSWFKYNKDFSTFNFLAAAFGIALYLSAKCKAGLFCCSVLYCVVRFCKRLFHCAAPCWSVVLLHAGPLCCCRFSNSASSEATCPHNPLASFAVSSYS